MGPAAVAQPGDQQWPIAAVGKVPAPSNTHSCHQHSRPCACAPYLVKTSWRSSAPVSGSCSSAPAARAASTSSTELPGSAVSCWMRELSADASSPSPMSSNDRCCSGMSTCQHAAKGQWLAWVDVRTSAAAVARRPAAVPPAHP
eukprot:309410-Chlamydomonas_euryale.AAC.11